MLPLKRTEGRVGIVDQSSSRLKVAVPAKEQEHDRIEKILAGDCLPGSRALP